MHFVPALVGVVARGALALRPYIAEKELDLHRDRHSVKIGIFPFKKGAWGKIRIVDLEPIATERVSCLTSIVVNLLAIKLIISGEILQRNPVRISSEPV